MQEVLRIGNVESFKAATVLAGGVARRGETCGALLGALMAVGLVQGRTEMTDRERYQAAMATAQRVTAAFRQRVQSGFDLAAQPATTLCRDLHKAVYGRTFDLNDPADYEAFLAAGGHSPTGCPKICGLAAEAAAEALIG